LNLLLEREEGRPVTLTGSLSTPPVVPSLEGLTAQAEEQNPQLAVQRQIVERERLNVKLAWSALVPDPAIDIAKRDNLGPGVSGPIIGLSFVVPLWDRKEGAIAAARSRLAAAEATLRANRLQVHQTLLTAYRNWETASGQVTLFSQGLVSQAEEAATLAERRYQEGEGDLLGVLDARRSLLAVRRDYAQALFDRLMAWIALERAAGIGTEH
jgi:cobalt-zinc-cadmium efflux system outer membrane protein